MITGEDPTKDALSNLLATKYYTLSGFNLNAR